MRAKNDLPVMTGSSVWLPIYQWERQLRRRQNPAWSCDRVKGQTRNARQTGAMVGVAQHPRIKPTCIAFCCPQAAMICAVACGIWSGETVTVSWPLHDHVLDVLSRIIFLTDRFEQ
jgi:hypothetical protein